MSIERRLARLEAAAGTTSANVDGIAVRAEILRLLTEEPEQVEALRLAALVQDCDLSLPSVVGSKCIA